MVSEFHIFTDFKQFLVADSEADWEDLYEKWTPEAVEHMFVQGDGYIAVGTLRDLRTSVTIRNAGEPAVPGRIDRSATGHLEICSGAIVVSGITDGGASGGSLEVPNANYRVVVDYMDLSSVSPDGMEGDDHYVVTLHNPAQPSR